MPADRKRIAELARRILNTGDTDFVKRYAGGGDMAQMMGAVGPEYMSSLANSAPAYSASPVETNVHPSQENETQV